MKMLIVEDNRMLIKTYYDLFYGDDIVIAERLSDIPNNLNKFDFVILDHDLPDGFGYEVVNKFKENNIPVIVISGSDTEVIDSKYKTCCFCKILRKPLVIKELMQAIKEILDNENN